jgi:hypothetical protein
MDDVESDNSLEDDNTPSQQPSDGTQKSRYSNWGLSPTAIYTLVRDVFCPHMERYHLLLLQNWLGTYLKNIDERRDEMLGGSPEKVLTEQERQWLEGVKTDDNPGGGVMKINAVKSLRDRLKAEHNYDMSIKEAKDYCDNYLKAIEEGNLVPMVKDQRSRWLVVGDTPENQLNAQEKGWLHSAVPPWDAMASVPDKVGDAVDSIVVRNGWPRAEAQKLVCAYIDSVVKGFVDPNRLLPEGAVSVGDDEGIVNFDDNPEFLE